MPPFPIISSAAPPLAGVLPALMLIAPELATLTLPLTWVVCRASPNPLTVTPSDTLPWISLTNFWVRSLVARLGVVVLVVSVVVVFFEQDTTTGLKPLAVHCATAWSGTPTSEAAEPRSRDKIAGLRTARDANDATTMRNR